jgi:hypothetical protein
MLSSIELRRGPLSLVSTIEEQLEIKSSGSGLESRSNHLALTSLSSGCRSAGIVRSRTYSTEFIY